VQMNCKKFITETKIFSQSSQTDTNANSIIFVNQGTSNVTVDGFLLTPNQSWNITGNENEINVKVYSFNFSGTGVNQLTVIFKRYV
jgi:hypothetical protein